MTKILFIHPITQLPRALECHNPSWSQHHGIPRGRVPALPFSLLVHTELTEAAHEDILARGKSPFHDFNEGFGNLRRLVLCESDLVHNGLDDVGLCQCHGKLHYVWG